MRRRTSREGGASLVEFALIAPVLFTLLLGTITGGLALSRKNSVTNAVREGGRLAATLPEGTGWSTDWAVDVRQRVLDLAGGDLASEDVCVQIIDVSATPAAIEGSVMGADCTSVTPPATPASATQGCIVKVWARTSADFNALFYSQDLTIDGSAVGLYERDECP